LGGYPTTKGVDDNSLLLAIITDMSDSKLINRFLIDKNDLTRLRKDLESRYEKVFSFLINSKEIPLKKVFRN